MNDSIAIHECISSITFNQSNFIGDLIYTLSINIVALAQQIEVASI